MSSKKVRTYGSAAALVAAGLVAGGVLAGSLSASAADGTPSPAPGGAPQGRDHPRPDETPLTGDTLAKVKAAVLAKYPGATVLRARTDRETGGYEAHVTKADGTRVDVLVSKAFAVTGEEQHRRRGDGPGAGETPLTGDTLAKVKAAVLAKYPGATVLRARTDRETGGYEAHVTKADGTRVDVLVSKAFAVTGEEQHRWGMHPDGMHPDGRPGGMPGDVPGGMPGAPAPDGAPQSG